MAIPQQPKINDKLLKRTAVFLIGLAVVFGGIRYVQSLQGDYDLGGESTGMIAAIRMEPDGQQIVLIDPKGEVKTTSSWKTGKVDREPVWAPDGKYLFFCSDREQSTFNVFRWNPQRGDAESRTIGGTSRGNPTFAPDGGMDTLLVVAGGALRELDPKTKKTPQILPPSNAEIAQSGTDEAGASGADASFASVYGSLGKSFRIGRYFGDKQYIAAVMKRDEGEVLIIQNLGEVNGKVPKPEPVVAGDHIDFDIDAKSGQIVFAVQDFRWVDPKVVPDQFRKGNKITVPFRNCLGLVSPGKSPSIMMAAPNDALALATPKVSPDGSRLLVVQGAIKEGAFEPLGLLAMPFTQAGAQAGKVVSQGDVHEPSWSSDSQQMLFAKRANGKRDIYRIGADGKEENLTKGAGDFYNPIASPMTK